jgi:hypothetical protein
MAITVKSLGSGRMTNADTLYDLATASTSPARAVIVKSIRLSNLHTSAILVNLYFVPSGGTARLISAPDLSMAAKTLYVDDKEVTLGSGDKIQGKAGTADKIEWVTSGVERDV